MSNKNKLKESTSSYDDTAEVKIPKNDYEKLPNKDALSQSLGDNGEITLTNEAEMNEVLKVDINIVMDALGIDFFRKSPEQKLEIKAILNNTIANLKAKGLSNMVFREGEDDDDGGLDWEDFEKADREVEYGIQSENFNKLMEDLKKSGAPKIELRENINPRIKKSDLINYIKNKKNVK